MKNKQIFVSFGDKKTEQAFYELRKGKFQDKNLYKWIKRAKKDLKENPFCGIQIQKKLIPKKYITEYDANNLWKYDLPSAWRLIYTIKGNEIMIISIILEWMTHKEYENRFGYT